MKFNLQFADVGSDVAFVIGDVTNCGDPFIDVASIFRLHDVNALCLIISGGNLKDVSGQKVRKGSFAEFNEWIGLFVRVWGVKRCWLLLTGGRQFRRVEWTRTCLFP